MIYPGIVRSRFEEEVNSVMKPMGFKVLEKQPDDKAGHGGNVFWVSSVEIDFEPLGGEDGGVPGGTRIGNMPATSTAGVGLVCAFDVPRNEPNKLDDIIRLFRSGMRHAADRLVNEDRIADRWTWGDHNVEFGQGKNPDRHLFTSTIELEEK